MKIDMYATMTVLATEARTVNGNEYYSIAVLQNAQAGTVSCSKDVFDLVESMCEYEFELSYNSEYKSIKASRIRRRVGVFNGGAPVHSDADAAKKK